MDRKTNKYKIKKRYIKLLDDFIDNLPLDEKNKIENGNNHNRNKA